MIDAVFVALRLGQVHADLALLEGLAGLPRAAFLQSATDPLVAERLLERIIGRTIDLNYHIVLASGVPPPTDFFASFFDLVALKVVSTDLATRVSPAAGLLNRIAYEYAEVDPGVVFDGMVRLVGNFREYLQVLERYCAAH